MRCVFHAVYLHQTSIHERISEEEEEDVAEEEERRKTGKKKEWPSHSKIIVQNYRFFFIYSVHVWVENNRYYHYYYYLLQLVRCRGVNVSSGVSSLDDRSIHVEKMEKENNKKKNKTKRAAEKKNFKLRRGWTCFLAIQITHLCRRLADCAASKTWLLFGVTKAPISTFAAEDCGHFAVSSMSVPPYYHDHDPDTPYPTVCTVILYVASRVGRIQWMMGSADWAEVAAMTDSSSDVGWVNQYDGDTKQVIEEMCCCFFSLLSKKERGICRFSAELAVPCGLGEGQWGRATNDAKINVGSTTSSGRRLRRRE